MQEILRGTPARDIPGAIQKSDLQQALSSWEQAQPLYLDEESCSALAISANTMKDPFILPCQQTHPNNCFSSQLHTTSLANHCPHHQFGKCMPRSSCQDACKALEHCDRSMKVSGSIGQSNYKLAFALVSSCAMAMTADIDLLQMLGVA